MKKLILILSLLLTSCVNENDFMIKVHVDARTAKEQCYWLTQPGYLIGKYCLIYMGNK